MMRLYTLGLLLVVAAMAGCSADERVELASYDFAEPYDDDLYGLRYGADIAVHAFGPDWTPPEGPGRWTVGREGGSIHLYALGHDARLTLVVSTAPPLAQSAQVARVLVNGQEVGRSLLRDEWRVEPITVDIPDEILVQGMNEVRLVPSHLLDDLEGDIEDPRPLGVYLRALYFDAEQTEEQHRRWKEQTGVLPVSPAWTTLQLPASSQKAPDPATLPDVVVILLDAARSDHFGCYGYPRDTTPHIDALARDGVMLQQVVADASYTRCSVTSLFTGSSWRRHEVIGKEDALAPEAVTWAEVMREAGYQTVAISDNANVSPGSGLDQGFDDFVAVWKQDRNEPEDAVRWFADRTARLSDAPAFVYTHLLPPHTPYFPGDFDRWAPADYGGEVNGSHRYVEQFDRGERPPQGPDYERLVSLYDGGLRRADAMVERILKIWRGLNRGRPTLLVVLSDHGEAFGEHGRFGHNSTVYDEMTRVPVILHPASAFEGLRESAGNLRALADVFPIVVRAAGVPLPAESFWPRRMLSVLEDPGLSRDEVFVRSSQRMLGVRTPGSLTVVEPGYRHEVYDLRSDPRQSTNLYLERTPQYLHGVGLLRAFLESTDSDWEAARATMSEQDIENLKALGYL